MKKSVRKQQDLQVKNIGNILVVSSLDVAAGMKVEHETIVRLIKRYENHFQDIRVFRFEIGKFGDVGRPISFCYLDEEQATFLITLMKNSDVVVEFKRKMTKVFFKMRKALAKQMNLKANAEWVASRQSGKLIRREETDTIKAFVAYAKAQGSQNAERYYCAISKMENRALFMFDQKYKNVRELLDIGQMSILRTADKIVERAIIEGMERCLNYKEIYCLAKDRIETLAKMHGKGRIPAADGFRTRLAA